MLQTLLNPDVWLYANVDPVFQSPKPTFFFRVVRAELSRSGEGLKTNAPVSHVNIYMYWQNLQKFQSTKHCNYVICWNITLDFLVLCSNTRLRFSNFLKFCKCSFQRSYESLHFHRKVDFLSKKKDMIW